MKTIVLAAAKGGVGKTTLTAALATAAALDQPGIRVGVVDLDPQGSLTRWWNDRAQDRPLWWDLAGASLSEALPALRAARFDLVFVDCPPGFSTILRQTIAAADLVLVPSRESSLDISAIASTVEMAVQAQVPHRTVLNGAVFRSRIAGEAVRTLREPGSMIWPPIHQRVEIAAAMSAGHTALETQPTSAAARELIALWYGVRAILDAPSSPRPVDRARMPVLAMAGRNGR